MSSSQLRNRSGRRGMVTLDALESRRLLAASVSLVDIGTFSAAPGQTARFGGGLLFSTYDRDHGQMLWFSNGLTANTQLLKDIDPAPSPAHAWFVSGRDNAIVHNGTFYFTAVDSAHGRELWRSDGTPDGTFIVRDIVEGEGDSNPEGFIGIGDQLFFTANHKIWKTDGTTEGTQQVRGVDPLGFHDDERMAVLDGELYFTTYPQTEPHFGSNNTGQLWKTDGTAEGTDLVADMNGTFDFTESIGPRFNLINVNDTLYFTANDGVHGFELWASDGTPQGTRMVADLVEGNGSSSPSDLVSFRGALWFAATGSLWTTDGTAEGTIRVSDVFNPQQLTPVGSTLYFVSDTGPHGRELWLTNGTPAWTRLVKDIRPEVPGEWDGSDPDNLLSAGNHVYFRADDGAHGLELWHTDGTPAGTYMAADFDMTGSSVAMPLGTAGANRLLASARQESSGRWRVWSLAVPRPPKVAPPKLLESYDSGTSNLDHITTQTRPAFAGEAMAGAVIKLYAGDVEVARTVAHGGSYTIAPTSPLANGRHYLTVTATDGLGQESPRSGRTGLRVDTRAPSAALASANANAIEIQFSDDVGQTLSLADMSLIRTDTRQVIPAEAMQLRFDDSTNIATITFPGVRGAALSAGPHAITISAKRVRDLAGNRLDRKTSLFFNVAPAVAKRAAARPAMLRIHGTAGDDQIIVRLKSGSTSILETLVNGAATERALASLSGVIIYAGEGNDDVRLDHSNGGFALAARIYGGAGDDTLTGGSGNDVIYGEDGNDVLVGATGNDYLVGGAGTDVITGNRGADRIVRDALDITSTDAEDSILS